MKYPESYVVYDLETTGLDTSTCEVLELAALKVNGNIAQLKTWLMPASRRPEDIEIRQKDGSTSTICKLTGITSGLLEREGIDPHIAWNEFGDFVGDLPLVGHNAIRYDNPIMLRYWRQFIGSRLSLPDVGRTIDTAALFKASSVPLTQLWHEDHFSFAERVLDFRAPVKFNLVHACTKLGIDIKDLSAHRAGGDVQMCNRLYRRMVGFEDAAPIPKDLRTPVAVAMTPNQQEETIENLNKSVGEINRGVSKTIAQMTGGEF